MTGPSPAAQQEERPSLARSTALMTVGTVISRVTGVIRLAVLAATLGVAETRLADTYNLANTAPNILYELVLGGVITSVFVPVFVELLSKEDRGSAWRSISAILNLSLVALTLVAVIGVVAAPWIAGFYSGRLEGAESAEQRAAITFLLRLFIPQVVLYGIYFVTSAILNARGRFALAMFTPIVNNLVLIGVLLYFRSQYGLVTLTSVTREQLLVIGLGTTASVAPMGLLLLPSLRRSGELRFTLRVDAPLLRRLLRLSGYVVGFVAANQVGYIVVQWLANGTKGGYTAYIAAFTFFLLPIGLFVWSLTTALAPTMSAHALAEHWAELRGDVTLAVRAILFLMVPAAVGFLVLGGPVVELFLEHGVVTGASTELIHEVLTFFVLGLLQFALFQVLVRAFYALQDAKTPFVINLIVVGLNMAINVPMYYGFGVKGLAAGQALAYTVGVLLQWRSLTKRIGALDGARIARTTLKVTAAASGMGLAAWATRGALEAFTPDSTVGQVAGITLSTVVGVLAYLALAVAMRAEEVAFVRNVLRARGSQVAQSSSE